MEETKVIYYIDDEDTPYMMKIVASPSKVTLKDFKEQLNRPYKKFFFRSTDDDIGVVKEEIADDDMSLPNVNGRVVCWVVTGEQGSQSGSDPGGSKERLDAMKDRDGDDVSLVSRSSRRHKHSSHRHHRPHGHSRHRHKHRTATAGEDSAVSGTDIDSQSDFTSTSYTTTDMESVAGTEDTVSRISASTLTSLQPRRKVLTKHRPKRSMSMSTVTATSVTNASMQIVQVTLNMDTVNFLGISIVGQTSEDGAGGIFVGSVMKGGAVAADGRIEPGDMLLEVNEISFENMSNDDAVKALREIVQQPGPITLTVAKCWEPEPVVPQFEPRMEPIRPIDPSAWVQQTNQIQGDYAYGRPFTGSPTLSTMTSNSSPSVTSSVPESEREAARLTITTPMYRIAKMLSNPTSGLDVKDRVWLKMPIPKSFIGSDLVDWLHTNVDGFIDRRHSRKYAALMLKHGFIRHIVNKITFSEQCYYIFGDFKAAANSLPSEFTNLHLSGDSGEDTLGPLPGANMWGSSDGEFSLPAYDFFTRPNQVSSSSKSNSPSPENKAAAAVSRHNGGSSGSSSAGNAQSGHPSPQNLTPSHPQARMNQYVPTPGGESPDNSNTNNPVNGAAVHPYPVVMRMKHSLSTSSGFTSVSQQQLRGGHVHVGMPPDRVSLRSENIVGAHGGLGVPGNLANSRESFQEALDNPCEFFIDVM